MQVTKIKNRFRKFLPVVIDVETGGFDFENNALLEVCAIVITVNAAGLLVPSDEPLHYAITPEPGLVVDPKSEAFLGYDPYSALRFSEPEEEALLDLNKILKEKIKLHNCSRAILVGHNASFDLTFLNKAFERHNINSALHSFSTFDTVTLAATAYGQTVLNQACQRAGLGWDSNAAHSALYDCMQTARLFCLIVNNFQK